MPITAREIQMVKESFREVLQESPPGSTVFYDQLFARAPQLRPLFRDDLAGQGMKFMTTLGTIVEALDRPDALDAELSSLAEGHAALGIKAGQFAPMGEALMDTFRATLGAAFSPALEAAWRAAYGEIADKMISKAKFEAA